MLGDYLCKVLTNIFGYIWPAYQCYKAVESNDTDVIRDWCIYWFTMAIFMIAERFVDMFVFWMPLYYEAKLLFVVWLWHPKTRGAVYLYTHTLQPFLAAHEQTIDTKLDEFRILAGDFIAGNFSKVVQLIQSQAHLAVDKLQSIQNKAQGNGTGGAYWGNSRTAAQGAMHVFGGNGGNGAERRKYQ